MSDCAGCKSRDAAMEALKVATRKDRDKLLAIADIITPKRPELATAALCTRCGFAWSAHAGPDGTILGCPEKDAIR